MRRKFAIITAVLLVTGVVATTALTASGGANEAGRYYYSSESGMVTACRC